MRPGPASGTGCATRGRPCATTSTSGSTASRPRSPRPSDRARPSTSFPPSREAEASSAPAYYEHCYQVPTRLSARPLDRPRMALHARDRRQPSVDDHAQSLKSPEIPIHSNARNIRAAWAAPTPLDRGPPRAKGGLTRQRCSARLPRPSTRPHGGMRRTAPGPGWSRSRDRRRMPSRARALPRVLLRPAGVQPDPATGRARRPRSRPGLPSPGSTPLGGKEVSGGRRGPAAGWPARRGSSTSRRRRSRSKSAPGARSEASPGRARAGR